MESLRFLRLPAHALGLFIVLGCVLTISAGDGNVVYEGNKVVVEGDPFTIICHTDVFDVIKWQLNEQTIIPDSQNQYILEEEKNNGKVVAKLSVSQAQNSHTGSYRCTSFSNVTHQVYVFGKANISSSHLCGVASNTFENACQLSWFQLTILVFSFYQSLISVARLTI